MKYSSFIDIAPLEYCFFDSSLFYSQLCHAFWGDVFLLLHSTFLVGSQFTQGLVLYCLHLFSKSMQHYFLPSSSFSNFFLSISISFSFFSFHFHFCQNCHSSTRILAPCCISLRLMLTWDACRGTWLQAWCAGAFAARHQRSCDQKLAVLISKDQSNNVTGTSYARCTIASCLMMWPGLRCRLQGLHFGWEEVSAVPLHYFLQWQGPWITLGICTARVQGSDRQEMVPVPCQAPTASILTVEIPTLVREFHRFVYFRCQKGILLRCLHLQAFIRLHISLLVDQITNV